MDLIQSEKQVYCVLIKAISPLSGKLHTPKTQSMLRPLSRPAKGKWSFRSSGNDFKIREIVQKFSVRYGVRVISLANVGNHLHFHIKLRNRFTYNSFIRALTGSIAMAITGAHRRTPLKKSAQDRFWDYRPFTRVVQSYRAYLNLRDYIKINELEGYGACREEARFIVEQGRVAQFSSA